MSQIKKSEPAIDLDVSLIPDHVRMKLLSIAYRATIEYFKKPGVEEAYQKWLAEKRKREAEAAKKPTGCPAIGGP